MKELILTKSFKPRDVDVLLNPDPHRVVYQNWHGHHVYLHHYAVHYKKC